MNRLIRLIYASFGLSIAVLLLLSGIYFKRVGRLDNNIRQVEHTSRVLLTTEELNSLFNANATTLRTAMLLKNSGTMTDVLIGNLRMGIKADSLVSLTSGNFEQKGRATAIKAVIVKREKLIRDSLLTGFLSADMEDYERLLARISAVRREYDSLYRSMRSLASSALAEEEKNKSTFERFTNPVLIILLGFSLLLIVVTFIYMMTTLRRRIGLQNELRAKVDSLNQANKELENLSRVTSHHIQEPMRKIRSFASMLEKRMGAIAVAEAREIVTKIEVNAANLQQLAQDLVQYGNLIQDEPEKESVDLNDLVVEVQNRLEDRLYETGAVIKWDGLPVIEGIPYQLFILFEELITNSIRFCRDNETAHIEIFEWHSQHPDGVVIAIRDRGIGFSQDYAERIFRLFEQLEPRSSPGRGIGLAMCARIMLNHGGTIRAEGSPGKGATFFLEFPGRKDIKPQSHLH